MERTNRAIDRNNASLRRQRASARAAGRGLFALAGTVTGLGDAMGVARGRTSVFSRVMAGLGLATGMAEPAVSALTVAVGGLSAGLTAGTVGLGAYGLASRGVLTNIKTLAELQKQASTGSKLAATRYQATLKTLSPPMRTFWGELQGTRKEYLSWSRSLTAPVLRPMTDALKLVDPLLEDMTPFARDASKALDTVILRLGKGIRSTGFKQWLADLRPLVRPTIEGWAAAAGHVAVGLGGVIHAFLPYAPGLIRGVDRLTGKFERWGTTLDKHSGFNAMITMWRDNWPLVRQGMSSAASILGNIVKAMAGLATGGNSKVLWQVANPMLALAAKLSGNRTLVSTFMYLWLISKGSRQIRGVFGDLKSGWGTLSKVLGWLTGGKITLGMQAAGDTMLAASANMQRAADTMAGASLKGGAGGKVPGVAKAGIPGLIGTLASPIAVTIVGVGTAAALAFGTAVSVAQHMPMSRQVQALMASQAGLGGRTVSPAVRRELDRLAAAQQAAQPGGGRPFTGRAGYAGIPSPVKGWDKDATAATNSLDRLLATISAVTPEAQALGSVFTMQGKAATTASKDMGEFTGAVWRWGRNATETRAARARLISDMISAGVDAGTARKDVDALSEAIHRHGYNSDAARAARRRLSADLADAAQNSRDGTRDIGRLTAAVRDHGARSDAARSARRRLIKDLEATGLDADSARGMVDRLRTALQRLYRVKSVREMIRVTGTGNWRATAELPGQPGMHFVGKFGAGGRIPGYGGGDIQILLAEPGETVVDKDRSRRFAPLLKAMGVPGFAHGGRVSGLQRWAEGRMMPWAERTAATEVTRSLAHMFATLGNRAAGPSGGPVTGDAAAAMRYAQSLLAGHIYGWSMGQWPPWRALGMGESGWNRFAYNAASGATGIPQALPYTKMPRAAWLPFQGGRAAMGPQVNWFASYMHDVYGTPARAYGMWLSRSPHWYGSGVHGWFDKPTVIGVAERGRERVDITPAGQAPSIDVRVFIGDRELTDLVRVEIREHDRQTMRRAKAGTGRAV